MKEIGFGAVESRFAEIIWTREPLNSGELVKICEKELSWKKSTVYTVLKKLCVKGIFKNESGVVTSLISKNEFEAKQTAQFVDEAFNGSLPAFIAAFTSGKKISEAEAAEIRAMIDAAGKGK